MSTSLNEQAAIDYMSSESRNVMWVLKSGPQTDDGFHSGAPIDLLSQYAAEQEGEWMLPARVHSVCDQAKSEGRHTRARSN